MLAPSRILPNRPIVSDPSIIRTESRDEPARGDQKHRRGDRDLDLPPRRDEESKGEFRHFRCDSKKVIG